MLYRLLTILVVAFWLAMTGLLLRKEFGPPNTALRDVPVAHVAKLMLTHEQSSDLQILLEKSVVGRLRLQPHTDGGQRRIDLSGTLQIAMPGAARQSAAWSGALELDHQLAMHRLKIALSLREPAGASVDLKIEPGERLVSYESRIGGQTVKSGRYSLDEAGVREWLRSEGIDPGFLQGLQSAQSSLVLGAREASLVVRGEEVATYLVSAECSGQTLFEAHVSQLGQILRLRTFAGYSAAPDDLVP
jgi:hypothetical protein